MITIKVMVIDDSLFMRTLISDMLNADPTIEVIDTAKSGAEAVKKLPKLKPDVITLDLVMPGWDGLTTLKHLMAEYPTPVIIMSAHSKEDAEVTLQCLHAGAVGFVLKPSGELSLDIQKIKAQLLDEVKAAAKVKVGKLKSLVVEKPNRLRQKAVATNNIVVIGASTGGMQALEAILPSLSVDFPSPIIVLQHVPSRFFTESLAERLQMNCELAVKVAENEELIRPGKVYIAPWGYRTRLEPQPAADVVIRLSEDDLDSLSPSIDDTMQSVANVYHEGALGVILSGIGQDGLEGMKAIKEAGGKTIAQDESSLIFGMPKAVIEAGYADQTLPPGEIASAVMASLGTSAGEPKATETS